MTVWLIRGEGHCSLLRGTGRRSFGLLRLRLRLTQLRLRFIQPLLQIMYLQPAGSSIESNTAPSQGTRASTIKATMTPSTLRSDQIRWNSAATSATLVTSNLADIAVFAALFLLFGA